MAGRAVVPQLPGPRRGVLGVVETVGVLTVRLARAFLPAHA
jgi:hypothetical protein